jgi:CP family cyanate transporter-like MFS transporter
MICRERYVDDEVPGLFGAGAPEDGDPAVEVAGTEPAVVVRER